MARIGTAFVEISGDFGPLRRQLAEMQRGRSAITIEVKADLDQASVARTKAGAATLGKDQKFGVKADLDTGSIARARAGMAVLTKESNKLGDVFNRSNLSIGQWTGILASALPVIVDLTGALGALTASAAAATVGLGALAIGMGGLATVGFGGIAAIAAPAISSLKDLMTAQEAANKARTTGAAGAARSAAASAQQIKSATEAVTAAEQQLEIAQESETVAQKALTLARLDAVRQLEDMKRAAIEGGTSEKRAQLSIKQAEENLRTVRSASTSTALDIKDAELSVVEARQNAKDVSIQAQRSQEDYNKAQKKGIDQMPGVVSAQQSLEAATRGVEDAKRAEAKATQNLAFQQKQANMATAAGGTSMAALALAQKKAGPEAVKFAKNLKELGQRWKQLTAAGKTDFFGLLNDGLSRVNARLPLFAKSANESMKALREGVDAFWAKAAAGPEFKTFIRTMTDTFSKALVPIGEGFGNIVKVLERISVAVAPDLLRLFRGFDEMTQGWVDSTRNATQLREVIHGLVNQANTWWKLLKATFNLLTAVLIPGMGKGKMAIEGITASLNEWSAWVEGHPAAMRDFFREGLETTKQLAQLLLGLLPTLFQISTAMRPIARAFLGLLKGLNSLKIGNVSALTVLLGAMVSAKLIKGLVGLVGTFNAVRKAALLAAGAEAAVGAAGGAGAGVGAATGFGSGVAAKTVTGRIIGSSVKTAAGSAAATGAATAAGVGLGTVLGVGIVVGVGALLAKELADKLKIQIDKAGSVAFKGGPPAGGGPLLKDSPFAINWTPPHPDFLDPFLGATKEADNKVSDLVTHMRKTFGTLAHAPVGVLERLRDSLDKLQASGEDTGGAFRDFTRRMREEFGSLVTAGAHMGKKQRDVYLQMAIAARQNGDITAKQFTRIENAMTDSVKKQKKSLRDAARATGESMQQIKRDVGDMTVTVSKDYEGMVHVTGHGIDMLMSNTSGALKAIGARELKWQAHSSHSIPGVGGGRPAPRKTGGLVVPGHGSGDKVPVRAMVEPGEVLAVLNRNAAKAWMKWNEKFPRFAKGGMTAMVSEANRFEKQHFPYSWGGGHGGFGIQPVDCSGAVSDILHAAGLLKAPMTSGSLMSWGKQGTGPLTVYANPHHTVMSLNGRVFGTSGSNPGGGAGWIDGASGKSLAPGAVRTMDVAGAIAGALKRILLKGPKGALTDMGQAALDKTWKAANAYIAKKMPAGEFGGGQESIYKGNLDTVFPHPGGPTIAAWQAAMLAEKAGLPGITYAQIAKGESTLHPGAISDDGGYGLWQMTPRVQSASTVAAWKRIGSYFNPWDNARMAKFLAGSGTGVSNYFGTGFWDGSIKHWHGEKKFARGGIAGPYVGKFHDGGFVGQDGLGLLQRGEMVLPGLQKGGSVAPSIPRDLIRGLRHLVHFTPEDSRKERRQEARLLRRIARTDGVKQLNLISKALGKYGVDFTKAEEKRLRKLSRDQAHGGGLTDEQHRELRHLRQESRQAGAQTDIREQIAVQREMIAEFKDYKRDAKERNRILRAIEQNEKGGMRAVSNYIASDIGFSQRQKARQASAGNVARY